MLLFSCLMVLNVASGGEVSRQPSTQGLVVKTREGSLEGSIDRQNGVRSFKGIPFAAPPVGELRWREPQPVKPWKGVRPARKFGPRAMQPPIFGDMVFRSDGMAEDCLYLNVWTPAKTDRERLPVLVYFYGGGYVAGDGSEPRYDGESMARRGIVAVTVNYRLGVFGFLSHPELTRESPNRASGNYGLLDQHAALLWVRRNIGAFGGDPKRITIAGESAGSLSVSVQMASPLSRGIIAGAIGESGAMIGPTLPAVPLAEAERVGVKLMEEAGAKSMAELRQKPADAILAAMMRGNPFRFSAAIDGYLLPKPVAEVYAAGEQAHVPLLVGWNSEEQNYRSVIGGEKPTPANLERALRRLYPERWQEAMRVYAGSTPDEVKQAATDLASDRFIAYSTWKWCDLHSKTGGKPVFRYYYARPRPGSEGAAHSAEIEYAMGNLATNKAFAWTPEDHAVSRTMQGYFANFIKTGNPNGPELPHWPPANMGPEVRLMRIDVQSHEEPERHRDRYLFLDSTYSK